MKRIADATYDRRKWFWDESVQTKSIRKRCRNKDTYRYRVLDGATGATILPEDDEYDPIDDEFKIKILYASLPFKDHSKYETPHLVPSEGKRKSDSYLSSHSATATPLP